MSHFRWIKKWVSILLLSQVSCSQYTAPMPAWVNFQPMATQTLWNDLIYSFQISDKYGQRPEVKKQVQYYLKNPYLLQKMLASSEPYLHYVLYKVRENKLPGEIALIPFVESRYDPFASSSQGATGLWQMMPGTASGLGVEINWWYDGRRDIITSTQAALKHLDNMSQMFNGDWLNAIAAYDAGGGTLINAIGKSASMQGKFDFWSLKLPQETKQYVPKVLALKEIISHHRRYHLELPVVSHVPMFKEVNIEQQLSIAQLAQWTGLTEKQFRLYNPGYRREVTEPGKHARLLIPTTVYESFLQNYQKQVKTEIQYRTHVVKPGDNLTSIAHQYHVSIVDIKKANKLTSSVIRVGQKLLISNSGVVASQHASRYERLVAGDDAKGPEQTNYIVKKNDTLSGIAARFGCTMTQIRYWNQKKSNYRPAVGDHLVIWQTKTMKQKSKVYTVAQGDSLYSIAIKYGMSVDEIKKINGLKSNVIRIGQVLSLSK